MITTDDMVMGSATAPVTVIEYASVACPVCAQFNNDQFPAFKTKYVDSGQVKYVFREILAHDPHMAAAGSWSARCAGKEKYFDVVDAIFKDQATIEQDINGGLTKVAKEAGGLNDKQVAECLADTKAIDALNTRVEKNSDEGKITGTPTFDINGQRIDALPQPGQLDAAIAACQGQEVRGNFAMRPFSSPLLAGMAAVCWPAVAARSAPPTPGRYEPGQPCRPGEVDRVRLGRLPPPCWCVQQHRLPGIQGAKVHRHRTGLLHPARGPDRRSRRNWPWPAS